MKLIARRLWLGISVPYLSLGMMTGAAAAIRSAESSSPGVPSAPFCGVYSLYTALRAEGSPLKFSQLLQPRYISSASGSTIHELCQAARDQGAYAQVLTNLGLADLHHLSCPAILHVKNEYDSPDYNHFVLCVPAGDGKLMLYDAPDAPTRSLGRELAASWDGTALLVSLKPIELDPLRFWAATRILVAVLVAMAILGAAGWSTRRLGRRRLTIISQTALLTLVAATTASVHHLATSQGFGAQAAAITAIRNAHFDQPAGQVDLRQAKLLLQSGARFIDARSSADYQQGHVDGAVDLPPYASRSDRLRLVAGLPRDARLVVYCQSPACPYAALLANRLVRDGFKNVNVFTGGWSLWSDSADSQAGRSTATAGEDLP